jgi:hypothetical protein
MEIHLGVGGRSTGQRNWSRYWIGEETSGGLSEDASETSGVKSLVQGSRRHCDGAVPTRKREFGEEQMGSELATLERASRPQGGRVILRSS